MAYKDTKINWMQLIQFTKNGVYVADYQSIRSAIVNRFKEIYGEDIDLSSASADGVYVETLSLMINNILQSFKQFYSQLDVRTASGPYLDALCSLSNVYRKQETNSNCSVTLTLDKDAEQNYVTKSISLLDKNGNAWTCNSTEDMTFEPGIAQSIIVVCETSGPIKAEPGWIDRLVSNEVTMTVVQSIAANQGSYSESDSQLRARRNSSLGATGNTVLETLVGTLLDMNGIDDAKIYNNDTNSKITALDGTPILQHDLYVILRKKNNINISDNLICQTIYEKLTPGIRTTMSSGRYGISKEVNYESNILGVTKLDITQQVCWKQASPIKPEISITIKALQNFANKDNETSMKIAENVRQYLNGLQLSSKVRMNDLQNVVEYSDALFRGRATFDVVSISVNGSLQDFVLPDTYFEYDSSDIKISSDGLTITLGSSNDNI